MPGSKLKIKDNHKSILKRVKLTLFFCLLFSPVFAANSPPRVGTIIPVSGTSNPNQAVSFTTTYTDPNGWQNIQQGLFLVNTAVNGARCFYGYYNQNTNKLYLRNDANTAWLGGFSPGSLAKPTPGINNPIDNSYATLNCAQTTVSGSGNTLTIKWSIVFKSTFTGAKNTYLYVKDDANLSSGWTQKGTWTIKRSDITPPTGTIKINNGAAYTNSTSVSLNLSATDSGSGMGQGAQMQFSHNNSTWSTPESYAITKAWTLLTGDGSKTVYVKFKDVAGNWSIPYSSTIILDTTAPTGSIKINNGAATTNSTSVTLNLSAQDAGSGVSQMMFSNDGSIWALYVGGYAISAPWTLTTGDGTKTVYAKFKDVAGNWSQAFSASIVLDVTPPAVPVINPVISPTTISSQMIAGSKSTDSVSIVVTCSTAIVGAVTYPTQNSWSCILSNLSLGANNIFVQAINAAGNKSALSTAVISYSQGTPQVGTVTPTSGSISQNQAITFTATYSHPDGVNNLKTVYFLINTSASGASCFLGCYDLDSNSFYLRDDADVVWLGGLYPGGYYNFIQNSQVYFDCSSSNVSKSEKTLTITWTVNFKLPFFGIKNIYLKAIDKSNASTDFVQKGDFCIFRAAVTPPQ